MRNMKENRADKWKYEAKAIKNNILIIRVEGRHGEWGD